MTETFYLGFDHSRSLSRQYTQEERNAIIAELKSFIYGSKKVDNFYFMTINFKPDLDLDQCLKALDRVAQRAFIKEYHYSIEQRGSTDLTRGEGIHSHWMVHTSKPLSEFKRDLFNTLKKYLGNQRHLDVRKYPLEYKADKLDYLKGLKWDPEKEDKVKQDILFRQENFLEDIYTNAPTPQVPPQTSST